jgi:hypothetical protein
MGNAAIDLELTRNHPTLASLGNCQFFTSQKTHPPRRWYQDSCQPSMKLSRRLSRPDADEIGLKCLAKATKNAEIAKTRDGPCPGALTTFDGMELVPEELVMGSWQRAYWGEHKWHRYQT